ncbi:ATP-binding cassette domain-containing protein [Mobiluncus curtisii]|nr:ATP-binding cassette domain-containing protein [Mobiluncus curtisii]
MQRKEANLANQIPAASPRFSTTLSPVSDSLISVRGLTKIYGHADTERAVTALDQVDVDFPRAQFTAIMGPSGSGKSSLLHILAGLDSFQSGTVTVAGRDLSGLNAAELTRFRRDTMGFIFQAFNLVPTLTVAENIELSALVRRQSPDRRRMKALVKELDLESRLDAFPAELSGGQQQKVACARALLVTPEVVFADEPTGNLDSESSAQVLSFLRAAARDWQQSVIMVTHEPDAAKYADRVLFLFDGQIVAQLTNPTREAILAAEQNLGEVRKARKRAGQPSAPQTLRDVDPAALEKDLTAVMSLPKIEDETDSEQPELPADTATGLPKLAPVTAPTPPAVPDSPSTIPAAHTVPTPAPEPTSASAPEPTFAPVAPPASRQRDTALTFANLGIAETNPEPNELADSLARGDFKWPSMSVAHPAAQEDTNDLLGKPLASGFANPDTTRDSASGSPANAKELSNFDSVISGAAELAASGSTTPAADSYETARPERPNIPDTDSGSGDTGFNSFDFMDKPARTASGEADVEVSVRRRRPILGSFGARQPAPTLTPAPTPSLPPDAVAPTLPTAPTAPAAPVTPPLAPPVEPPVTPPVAPPVAPLAASDPNAWVDNPPTLVPSSASSRILSEAFVPEAVPAPPAEPELERPELPDSFSARYPATPPAEAPTAVPSAPQPQTFPTPRRVSQLESTLSAPDAFARQPELQPEPRPAPQPTPAPQPAPQPERSKPAASRTYDGPRRSRRPAVDPHLAEAEGKNELLAMIEQAEKLLAASGAAINAATETLQEPDAPRDSRASAATRAPRSATPSATPAAPATPATPANSATPHGGNPSLPSRGKTPDQELLIARADAMLAQAEARSAALQDDLRNLGRTPAPASQAMPGTPVPPEAATTTAPGTDTPETFPPDWRPQSLRYPPKGR